MKSAISALASLAVTLAVAGAAIAAEAPNASRSFVTRHSGVFNGKKVSYLATVSETVLDDGAGTATARFFSTSYVRESERGRDARPVLFLFNGGPGAASIWLHFGAFGPKRVALPEDITAELAPPYRLIDNAYTVLDVADLVFVDPAETGFSRILPHAGRAAFYSTAGDAKSVAQFIETWTRANGRASSPKYLFGESYGTIRAVLVADELSRTTPVDGVVLFGQAVNIVETVQRSGNITGYATNLPALAAIAAYHRLIDLKGRTVRELIDEAYAFGMSDYLLALAKGRDLSAPERTRIATRLAELTGLTTEYYLANGLVISKERFRSEILKNRGLIVGQYDARYTGPAPPPGERATDPSMKMAPAFTALAVEYFTKTLGVTLPEEYRPQDSSASSWDWSVPPSPFSDYDWPASIARVMKAQPDFRLMIGTGIYDTTTTIGPARYLVARVGFPDERVAMRDYDGGHMAYTNEAALKALTDDVRAFLQPPQVEVVQTAVSNCAADGRRLR